MEFINYYPIYSWGKIRFQSNISHLSFRIKGLFTQSDSVRAQKDYIDF